jgi:hypothetical protein
LDVPPVTRGSTRNAGLAADRADKQGPGYKAQEQTLRAALGEREAVAAVLQSHQRRLSTPGYRLIDQSESESEGAGRLRRSERISERD